MHCSGRHFTLRNSKKIMIYLGVDGGGTKTAFALIDQSGEVLAEHQEKTCYHILVGLDGARNVLQRGIQHTLAKANVEIKDLRFAFFGLPAYGEDTSLTQSINNIPSEFIPQDRYRCDNDMVNGWAAAFDCDDGINIVAGTGSIAYGTRRGKVTRCGGWGELFGDEGSAYWVGRRGLMTFSKMSDGRLEKGPLYTLMKSHLGIDNDLDVSGLVHSAWQADRTKIAELSTVVSRAANKNDVHALKIFQSAGQELALIVDATKQSLGYSNNEPVPVSYSGGVFNAEHLVLAPFISTLNTYSSLYTIQKPQFTPVIGAARYARKLSIH